MLLEISGEAHGCSADLTLQSHTFWKFFRKHIEPLSTSWVAQVLLLVD